MISFFNITQQGQRHVELEIPCQDYSKVVEVQIIDKDKTFIVAALGDGVGSCTCSEIGSMIAVETITEELSRSLVCQGEILNHIESAFKQSLLAIEEYAIKNSIPICELDTTLTVTVYDGENLWYGHIGDGGVVVLYSDGNYEMITNRHKGEEANSVVPLRFLSAAEYKRIEGDVVSYVMMTDGVLDFCVDSLAMNNRVFFPFLEPALTGEMKSKEQTENYKKEWETFFSEHDNDGNSFRNRVTDDISFIVVQNNKKINGLDVDCIYFDQNKWDEESEKRRKQIEEMLYADYWKYKEELNNSQGTYLDEEV